ncbi:MAG: nicotinate phosphoribosyltransferase [Eubacteriales bacterium]
MNLHENLTMLCDYYQLTMANGYHQTEMREKICYFELFFRSVPDKGGFAICAGLAQVVEYIQNLHFSDQDIEFLRNKKIFSDDFLEHLKEFRFTGDLWAVEEGTPVFPKEPLLIVRSNAIEAQFIETYLLLAINHQTLVASKSSRIVRAAEGRTIMEFGARRAQGASAAVLGARASYIAGCHGTGCTMADEYHGAPAMGTMAHSWVQMFDSELEAFDAYCDIYHDNVVLLVDTYDVLKSGVPNAITSFHKVLKNRKMKNFGIRLDSGDLTYLSIKAREMLDQAGLEDCKIVASNALDEYIIRDIIQQGAQINSFGVGERLITSRSEPVFGGVYKLVAVENEGKIVPKIKISENPAKVITPHFKKAYRIFSKASGKAEADYLCLHDEEVDATKPLELFDPDTTWKRKVYTDYELRPLLKEIFRNGELVYELPTLEESRAYCAREIDTLWPEVKRFENPHHYYVDLSQKLWDNKQELLAQHKKT